MIQNDLNFHLLAVGKKHAFVLVMALVSQYSFSVSYWDHNCGIIEMTQISGTFQVFLGIQNSIIGENWIRDPSII